MSRPTHSSHRPGGASVAAVLLLAAAATLAPMAAARAQDCPAGPWPTTRFEVIHERTPADFEMWLTGLYTGLIRGEELAGDQEASDVAWDRLVEGYLQDIARRLEEAGFGCPDLFTIGAADQLRYPVYLVDLGNHVFHGWHGRSGVAPLHPLHPLIPNHFLIDKPRYSNASGSAEQELYGVLAHELFHIVQATYESEFGSIRHNNARQLQRLEDLIAYVTGDHVVGVIAHPGADFVVEGGANGVEEFLVSLRFPGYREAYEDSQVELGGFSYDHEYFIRAPAENDDAYKAGSFWLHVAERYGGLPTIQYFLRQPLGGLSIDDRTRWIERGLSASLKEVFPHFLTELASYGWSRYERVAPETWLTWTMLGCGDRKNDPGGLVALRADNTHAPWFLPPMPPITGRCVNLEWSLGGAAETLDNAALMIQVFGPSEDILEQLHVGLANSTIQPYGNCWAKLAPLPREERRRKTCVLDPDSPPFEVDGAWSRTWTLDPGVYEFDGEATFVISNVAENAVDTEKALGLEVRFQFLYEYAAMGTGGGGGSASQIEAPAGIDEALPIRLDRLSGNVFPLGASHLELRPWTAGLKEPCVMRLGFKNDRQDFIAINLDHEGPIGPGSYSIMKVPRFEDPRTTGRIYGGFIIGRGNPLSGGRAQEFGFESGEVVIESVSGGLLRGHLVAAGWRCPDCNLGIGEEPYGYTNMAIRAEFAVLIKDPTRVASEGGSRPGSECLAETGGGMTGGGDPQKTKEVKKTQKEEEKKRQEPQEETASQEKEGGFAVGERAPGDAPPESEGPSTDRSPGETPESRVGEVPALVNTLELQSTGAVDTTFTIRGSDIDVNGGCPAGAPLSLGFWKGLPHEHDYLKLGFTTADVVKSGQTGTFPLREIDWDHGIRMHPVRGGGEVAGPNRYSGSGTLTLTEHRSTTGEPRLRGSLQGTLNGADGSAQLTARFDISFACSPAP